MDIRDAHGVQINKLPGSRVEYSPFPGGFKIVPGYVTQYCNLTERSFVLPAVFTALV